MHTIARCPVFIASRGRAPSSTHRPKSGDSRAAGARLGPGGGGRRCLEVPRTGYTATANSNLNPGPHGPEP